MTDLAARARRRIRSEHDDVVSAVDRCADAVSETWDGAAATEDGPRTADPDAIVAPLRAALSSAGVLDRFPAVLVDAVAATGHELAASPVPAPPYVVVTSRGPLCRATIAPGRLVVAFEAFAVERESGPAYRRLDDVRVDVSLVADAD